MNAIFSRSGFAGFLAAAAGLFAVSPPATAASRKVHRVGFHIDQNDPAIMNLLLGNFTNLMEYYAGEAAEVEIVAYGPGLNVFRTDTSPVKDRQRSSFAFLQSCTRLVTTR